MFFFTVDECIINFANFKDVSLAFSTLATKFQVDHDTSLHFLAVRSRCIGRAKRGMLKEKMRETHSIHDLLQLLEDNNMFFNWMNISFLETIAATVTAASGNNKLYRLVQNYKDAIYSRTLRQVWDDIPSYKKVKNKYYSKLQGVFGNKDPDNVTVKEVITQCTSPLIRNIALDIMEITEGSLKISWLILTDEVYHAFLSLLTVPEALRQDDFLQVGAWIVYYPQSVISKQRKIHG